MNKNFEISTIFLIFCLYIYISAYSFSNLISDDIFYFSLNISRILLTLLLIILVSILGLKRKSIIAFISALTLLVLNDSFFTSLAYLITVCTLLYNYIIQLGPKSYSLIFSRLNKVSIFAFVSIITLSYFSLIPNNIYSENGEYSANVRYALGFSNPNPASLFILQSFLIAYCLEDRKTATISLIIFVVTSFFFVSKTAIALLILFLIIYLLLHNKYIQKIIVFFTIFSLVSLPIFIMIFISKGSWIINGIDINLLLTTRLSGIKLLYETYEGIPLLPQSNEVFIDSGISNFLIKGGWLLYILAFFYITKYLLQEKNLKFLCLVIIYLCFSFSENIFNGNLLLSLFIFAHIFLYHPKTHENSVQAL